MKGKGRGNRVKWVSLAPVTWWSLLPSLCFFICQRPPSSTDCHQLFVKSLSLRPNAPFTTLLLILPGLFYHRAHVCLPPVSDVSRHCGVETVKEKEVRGVRQSERHEFGLLSLNPLDLGGTVRLVGEVRSCELAERDASDAAVVVQFEVRVAEDATRLVSWLVHPPIHKERPKDAHDHAGIPLLRCACCHVEAHFVPRLSV
mmetsp:Transcript_10495/g.20382  ORF Transcript_10495/g.20382 Transcript_10495/m.20382 type:complete len:201 (+) Transcript_10495:223-825(+)